jgi:capsular exopolysaccharide synthesis family protein
MRGALALGGGSRLSELSPYFIERLHEHPAGPGRGALAGAGDEQPDLREYWRVVRRHLALIATIALGVVTVVGVAVFVATPIYTASAVILIEPQPPQVLDMKQLMVESSNSAEHDYYKTQYSLLQSESLAAQVIKSLGLQRSPVFNDSNRPRGLIANYWSGLKAWVNGLSGSAGAARRVDPPEIDGVGAALVRTYLGDLSIRPEFGTRLVKISFSTPDPRVSATVANAHARAYVNQGMELRARASQAAQQFLERKLVELRDRVEKSEAALNSYRHDKGIVEFSTEGKNEILLKRLEDLNNALTAAETKRIALESQADLISKGDYYALPGVVSSPMVQALKPQLATLEAQYASMASRYTLEYGPLVALKAKLDGTRARLDETVGEIVRSVRLRYQAAVARENELQREVAQEKARALALNDASLKDAILARDVDTNRQLYESVLKRMKEMGVAAEVRATNVSVVDNAVVPAAPSSPRKGLALMLAAMLGLTGAIGVAFLIEYLDDTFRTAEDVERHLRLPMLALVPDMSRLQNGSYRGERKRELETLARDAPELLARRTADEPPEKAGRAAKHGRWALATAREAYRTVRSQILLSRAGEPPKTVLITSAVAGEGKSITAVNTAITFAHKGRRVLLLDADLRKARCHELLRCASELGLAEVLTGQTAVDEVINRTAVTNLFFIGAGAVPPDPPELLGSARMGEVLRELGARYDHVIIDSAPVMPVSDSVVLSRHVDGVIVIAGRTTSRQLVKRACLRVGDAGARILGVVLNQVGLYHASYYSYNGYHHYSYYSRTEAAADGPSEDHARIVFD